MSDNFGFSGRKKLAEKIAQIPGDAATDDVADKHGFVSREPVQPFRRPPVEPVVTLHTRAPLRVATPFQQFCAENRYSYWEGIEELMRRAGVV